MSSRGDINPSHARFLPQVQIRDVHVRFEDDITSPSGTPFAFGFSIESLTAQTCDENWTPKFVHREHSQPMAYKLVELQNMATYLNTEAELFGTLPVAELKVVRRQRS